MSPFPSARGGRVLLALCGTLPLAFGIRAQTSDALPTVEVRDQRTEPNGRLNLDAPAETASRLGLTPRETPASVTIVDRAAIEARGAQDTQEMLRAIPGMTAAAPPGNPGVWYRGFNAVSQMFNGINLQYSIAARPVDSWIYERVEAIGGPSSFLYGAGAIGGSVNYITKVAQPEDFSEARLRFGSHRLKEASVGLNRRIAEGHHARIDLNQRDGGGWSDGTHPRSTQLAASLRSDFGGGVRHLLAYEYQKERVERPYWGTPALNPLGPVMHIDERTRFNNYNSADGLYAQKVQWLRSVTEWQASDALQWKNTFYVYDALRDYRNVESYRYTPNNTGVVRSSSLLQRHDHRVIGDRLEGQYRGTLGGLRSDWSFGLEASLNKQTRFPNSLSGTVSTVNPYAFVTEPFFTIPGMVPGFRPDRDNRTRTVALTLENRTALRPDLHLVTALRHERIELELTNRRAVSASAPAFYERSYSPTTGRIGLVWDLAPGASLYAQYATAADPPSGTLSTASFADVIGNTRLTTGRQAEVGAKFGFWDGRGNATVAAYTITRKNIATPDPNNPNNTVLVGQQSAKGVELSAGLQATERLTLQGNVAWSDPKYDSFREKVGHLSVSRAGNRPTNTPALVANLWASYALTPSVEISAGVRHVGKIYADAANTLSQKGYWLLDLGLRWQVNKSVSLTARVRNATDRVYASSLGSTFLYLGAPRTADLTLHAAF